MSSKSRYFSSKSNNFTYFKVFSGDDEDILNKIIKARETYGYVETCVWILRDKKYLHPNGTQLKICEIHTFGLRFYPKFLEKHANFLWIKIVFLLVKQRILNFILSKRKSMVHVNFIMWKTKNIEFYYGKYYPEKFFKFLNLFSIFEKSSLTKNAPQVCSILLSQNSF